MTNLNAKHMSYLTKVKKQVKEMVLVGLLSAHSQCAITGQNGRQISKNNGMTIEKALL